MSRERGFALIAAIVLAVLYFALVELLLLDSSRELAEARRFRARIVALTLAEDGAELAAAGIVDPSRMMREARRDQPAGKIEGRMAKTAGGQFDIEGKGESTGEMATRSTVRIRGRIVGNDVRIQYSVHIP